MMARNFLPVTVALSSLGVRFLFSGSFSPRVGLVSIFSQPSRSLAGLFVCTDHKFLEVTSSTLSLLELTTLVARRWRKRDVNHLLFFLKFVSILDQRNQRIYRPHQGEDLLHSFTDTVYCILLLQKEKVVTMEDLAAEFNLKTQVATNLIITGEVAIVTWGTCRQEHVNYVCVCVRACVHVQDAIARLQSLKGSGELTGVIDDRGKFIYISTEEMQAVANFIKQKGRVSISELVSSSNTLINLKPAEHDLAQLA